MQLPLSDTKSGGEGEPIFSPEIAGMLISSIGVKVVAMFSSGPTGPRVTMTVVLTGCSVVEGRAHSYWFGQHFPERGGKGRVKKKVFFHLGAWPPPPRDGKGQKKIYFDPVQRDL